jgi:signal transduction histidine kinase
VSLTVREMGPSTPLLGDADLVCQVMLELVANAAAVTLPGGEITLASEVRDQAVILSVSDQGPGVPPEERSRIFDPFVSNRTGGTGIGLAVARQIVLSQRGSLSVHTSDTGGARLEIALPLAVSA